MPLYEYRCRRCGHSFEALVRGSSAVVCPACNADDLERLLSLFGVATEGSKKSALSKARKAGEKERRDKAVADREQIEHHQH